jgi:hypothetical protein
MTDYSMSKVYRISFQPRADRTYDRRLEKNQIH